MAKADKIHEARLQGMYYAYAKIKENGIDEFAKELEYRSKRGVQLLNTRKDQQKFEKEIIDRVQDVVMIFAVAVLADEFDFGSEEVNRFLNRLQLKADCISDKYITWEEQQQIIKDELGIDISFKGQKT
jgi:hypothetical protein